MLDRLIHKRSRLVEQEHGRAAIKLARDRDPLALTARELAAAVGQAGVQAGRQRGQDRIKLRQTDRGGQGGRVDLGRLLSQGDVGAHRLVQKWSVLRHETQFPLPGRIVETERFAVRLHSAAVGSQEGGQQQQQGAFTPAGRTDQGEPFSGPHLEGRSGEGGLGAVLVPHPGRGHRQPGTKTAWRRPDRTGGGRPAGGSLSKASAPVRLPGGRRGGPARDRRGGSSPGASAARHRGRAAGGPGRQAPAGRVGEQPDRPEKKKGFVGQKRNAFPALQCHHDFPEGVAAFAVARGEKGGAAMEVDLPASGQAVLHHGLGAEAGGGEAVTPRAWRAWATRKVRTAPPPQSASTAMAGQGAVAKSNASSPATTRPSDQRRTSE